MMKQLLLCRVSQVDFTVAIETAFVEGWRVVPGSIAVSVAMAQSHNTGTSPQVLERYVAVLERKARMAKRKN